MYAATAERDRERESPTNGEMELLHVSGGTTTELSEARRQGDV
jgi:hypothetical protein